MIIVEARFWKAKSFLYFITTCTALVVITRLVRKSCSRSKDRDDNPSKSKATSLQSSRNENRYDQLSKSKAVSLQSLRNENREDQTSKSKVLSLQRFRNQNSSVNENIVPINQRKNENFDSMYYPSSPKVTKIWAKPIYKMSSIHKRDTVYLDIKRYISKRIKIHSVFKIDNTSLECSYKMKKMQKQKMYPYFEEIELFHGTERRHVDSICMNNFNWRFHGNEVANKFGKGVYFTSSAMYATNYSDKDNNEKVMFIAQLLIGKKCLGKKCMNLPPKGFDTTTNNGNDDFIVIKYEDNEFFPKYMITYHLLQECVKKSANEKRLPVIHEQNGYYDSTHYPLFSKVVKWDIPVLQISPIHEIENVYFEIKNRICNKHIKIHSIFSINNTFLERSYEKKKMKQLNNYPALEEVELFHGTKRKHVNSICMNNFNWRFYGKEVGNKFGKGVCFTSNAKYATNYSDKDNNYKVMIIAKVLIGKKCLGTKVMNLPPEGFDTTTKQNNNIVVVKYEDNEFYPKYIIRYHLSL